MKTTLIQRIKNLWQLSENKDTFAMVQKYIELEKEIATKPKPQQAQIIKRKLKSIEEEVDDILK